MSNKDLVWLYSLVGYTTDFRKFMEDFNEALEKTEVNIFPKNEDVWDWVAHNCYGNYAKDNSLLKRFQNIVINYDEIENLVSVQVFSSGDKYLSKNKEYFAKEVLVLAADLLSEPNHWIVGLPPGNTNTPANYYVSKVPSPASVENFHVEDSMYGSFIDDFGKELSTISGYKSMMELVSESGSALSNSLNLDRDNIVEFLKSVVDKFEENPSSIESIQEPYKFFELEYKPITPTIKLIRNAAKYLINSKCYATSNLYTEVPEDFFVTTKPTVKYSTNSIIYHKDSLDFIKSMCEIENEVLGTEIENQLKLSEIDNVDDFFSD